MVDSGSKDFTAAECKERGGEYGKLLDSDHRGLECLWAFRIGEKYYQIGVLEH